MSPRRFLSLVLAALAAGATLARADAPGRERRSLDAGWHFAFGHATDPARDFDHGTGYFSHFAKAGYGDGPAAAKFDDSAWRVLDLPHDWAVEAPFSAAGSESHGYKAIGRNFPERSIGWYRRSLTIPASDLGRRVRLEFDGAFRNTEVWVNGFYLGREPSGYTGFGYDVTDLLNYGGDNTIAVRVDATAEEGWFYEGAGLYRHVWLTKTAPLHVLQDGTFVTTEVGSDAATVTAATTVVNDGRTPATFTVEQTVTNANGAIVATGRRAGLTLAPGATTEATVTLAVAHPALWSPEHPHLYRLETVVHTDAGPVDATATPFGIRTVRFDPDHGFFLNGERVEIKGVNNHLDFAGVGVAVPAPLQDYRIRLVKAMGANAWRCAHNPPDRELLDACDRLGLLVLDENRLMSPTPDALSQLERMIRRDRNHPSVILWSIGNEEWAIEGNIKGARFATTLQDFVRRLDPTRRITAANSGGWGGTSTTIDVVGYNYIHQSDPDGQHAKFPQQPGVGTEESTTRQTRGVYADAKERGHVGPIANAMSGGNNELGWQYYAARPFLAGVFFWTGFDYRGEPHPYGWPQVASQSGLMDLCGFPKDSYHYLQAWWSDAPVLHLSPHWTWPGREGQPITVVCFSNHDEVELLLNGRALGRQPMPRNGRLEWKVAYAPGVLEARGYRAGTLAGTTRVETAGPVASLRLVPDHPAVTADGDVIAVTVEARDAQGRPVPTADADVTFALAGAARIIGVGNGDPGAHEPEQFLDTIDLVPVADWRGKIAPPGTTAPSAAGSQPPLPALGNWLAPRPKADEVLDLSAAFTLDQPAGNPTLQLHLPPLGRKTTVWLNGREIARDVDTSVHGPVIPITADQLSAQGNRLQLLVQPLADGGNHIPELTRLGCVQVRVPAPAWHRHLFNGLAQVLVRASEQSAPVTLTARSPGLPDAKLELDHGR